MATPNLANRPSFLTNVSPSDSMPRNSQRQLVRMLDSIAEGIYCVDLTGACTYCNARCLELLGFNAESELLGKNMHDLIHHHRRDDSVYDVKDCKIYQAYHADESVHVDNEVFFRKDKSRFDAEYWSYPLKEDGKVIGAVVSFIDITHKRIETAHRNHLAQLVETSHDAIISRNLDGCITSWNQGAKEIYGYDADEMIGQSGDLILPPGQEQLEAEVRVAISGGVELPQFEVRRKRKSGEICFVSITISPLNDADGKLIGCSCIERDITVSRRSQDAIMSAMTSAEHAEEMAQKANKSRTEFLANVSHELRTPMNAILGMLNLSLEEKLTPVIADYLNVAKTSADTLLELVNELLDFAKIESGKFEIANEPFNLRDVIDVPAKVMSGRASEKGLEILCEVDSSVPSILLGDGRRIQQVLTNLLSNAVKFTDHGEIIARVEVVRELPEEVRLQFSVSDTGVGISAEDQANVLLPFQQADMSSTRKHHGTGLGLSICRELIALMGGILKLESEPGKGSRFYFNLSLPIEDQSKPSDSVPTELVRDLKVLIVDDNPTNLRILEKIFVSWSMQPIVSTSADQAIRILDELEQQDECVSMAIVDSLMPKVDGYELADMFAKREGDQCPPIVMMQSAADMGMYSDRKSDAPVSHYLTKPVSQSELLDAVVDTLDLYSHSPHNLGLKAVDPAAPIAPLNILLVEDLPANQKVAKAILGKRGHKVVAASNGRVAVEQMQSSDNSFDVILMDVQMPVMDGLQATTAIRALADAEAAETPIIAMTAHAMQGDRETCLAAGMDAYISKPLDAKRLVELTESIAQHPDEIQAKGESEDHGSEKMIETPPNSIEAINGRSADPGFDVVDLEMVEYESSLKRLGGDKELFEEFVEIFLADSPKLLAEISDAIQAKDATQLEKSAHALKGLTSNFGARPCVELTLEMEIAGRDNNIEAVTLKRDRLNRLYQQLSSELSIWT